MAFLLGRSTRGGGGHCFCLICGGRWQIPQDWAKTCRPNFCVAVNPSSVAACCADAPPAASTAKTSTPKRTAERTAALRFILDPPDTRFFASLRRRRVKRKARPRTRRLDRHAFLRAAGALRTRSPNCRQILGGEIGGRTRTRTWDPLIKRNRVPRGTDVR